MTRLLILLAVLGDAKTPLPLVYRPGLGTVMPPTVDQPSHIWMASAPTLDSQTGQSVCTANLATIANQSAFCPAGTAPGGGCSFLWGYNPAEDAGLMQFPVKIGNAGTGSQTLCVAAQPTSSLSAGNGGIILGATNDLFSGGFGNVGYQFYADATGGGSGSVTRGKLLISDGSNHATVLGSTASWSGMHFFCFTFAAGSTAQIYFDGAASGSSVSVASIGNTSSTHGLGLGATPVAVNQWGAGALQMAVWYSIALTSSDILALYNQWKHNGLGLYNPLTYQASNQFPKLLWFASNPLVNYAQADAPPVNMNKDALVPAPVIPVGLWCGDQQSQTGPCMASQVFFSDYQSTATAQYFDCGNAFGDPGPPSGNPTSPTNDFTWCALYRGRTTTTSSVVTWGNSNPNYQIGIADFYVNPNGNPINMLAFANVSGESGMPMGDVGTIDITYMPWTLGCGVVKAQDSVQCGDTVHSSLCGYMDGIQFNQIGGIGSSSCDCATNGGTAPPNFHSGSFHFFIGAGVNADGFIGEVAWAATWFGHAETAAQMKALAAKVRLAAAPSQSSYCQMFNGQAICFSPGM